MGCLYSQALNRRSGIWDWAMGAFCRVCFCCPGFQHIGLFVTSTVLGFLHIQPPQSEFSPSWASAVLGPHITGAEPRLLWAGYIQVTAPDMLGGCIISSVLSCHNKDLKWRTSVTTRLLLRVLFGKQRIVHFWGMRADGPQRRCFNPSWLPVFIHFVSSPFTCPMQIRANQEGGVFVSLEVLTPGLQIFFCSIFMGFFPLSFSHHHFGLLFPILTTQCERVLLSRFKS